MLRFTRLEIRQNHCVALWLTQSLVDKASMGEIWGMWTEIFNKSFYNQSPRRSVKKVFLQVS